MIRDFNTDVAATGIPAVDMLADNIMYARKKMLPVKTAYLSKKAYGQFLAWVGFNLKDEFDFNAKYQFDGVNIEQGSSLMIKDCYLEYYGKEHIQA